MPHPAPGAPRDRLSEYGPARSVASFSLGASGGTASFAGGYDPRGARTADRFRARVLAQFESPENLSYLRGVFRQELPPGPLRDFALDTLDDSVREFGKREDLLYSDPIAQRGDLRPAANMWSEVSRLNLAFYAYRMQFIRDKSALLSGQSGDGQWDDDEPYHYRMLVADSIRPPGLEHLNTPGPLYGILEDQVADRHSAGPQMGRSGAGRGSWGGCKKEAFAPGAPRSSPATGAGRGRAGPDPMVGVAPTEWGWDGGDPNRTAEQAIAEYWGEGHVESTALGAAEQKSGLVNGSLYCWGDTWKNNGGTRFMRYEEIPFWQKGGIRAHDYDIEGDLGTGIREADTPVRRWETDRMREPRGEEYRHYGPRSGSFV